MTANAIAASPTGTQPPSTIFVIVEATKAMSTMRKATSSGIARRRLHPHTTRVTE